MREAAFGQRFEGSRELGRPIWCEVETKRLDCDEPALDRIVRAEDHTRGAGTDLMQNTKRAEGGRG